MLIFFLSFNLTVAMNLQVNYCSGEVVAHFFFCLTLVLLRIYKLITIVKKAFLIFSFHLASLLLWILLEDVSSISLFHLSLLLLGAYKPVENASF